MNTKSLVGLVAMVALLAGAVGGCAANQLTSNNLLGGDFAGGIQPALHSETTTGGLTGNGHIYPARSLVEDAANGLSVGGSDQ